MSDEDLSRVSDDPYEYAQEMYRTAKSQYIEDTPYDEHGELQSTLSDTVALEGKFENDEEIAEFDEFVAMVWENMDTGEREGLLMASEYGGDTSSVEEWAEFLYNEFTENKEDD